VEDLVTLPEFARVDMGAYYAPNEHLRMQLNVENPLDARYYPNANGNNNITPRSPLAIRAGVTMQF
jgi:catecholate siderophore receptor